MWRGDRDEVFFAIGGVHDVHCLAAVPFGLRQGTPCGRSRHGKGRVFEAEVGIPLDTETLWELRDKALEQLPEADDNEDWPEDSELPLDNHNITLAITVPDGTVLKKKASGKLSMEIDKLLLLCLKNYE